MEFFFCPPGCINTTGTKEFYRLTVYHIFVPYRQTELCAHFRCKRLQACVYVKRRREEKNSSGIIPDFKSNLFIKKKRS